MRFLFSIKLYFLLLTKSFRPVAVVLSILLRQSDHSLLLTTDPLQCQAYPLKPIGQTHSSATPNVFNIKIKKKAIVFESKGGYQKKRLQVILDFIFLHLFSVIDLSKGQFPDGFTFSSEGFEDISRWEHR